MLLIITAYYTQLHQLCSHYLTCHAAMHILSTTDYKLLRQHVRYTMAINTRAQESLIVPNGAIAAIFSIGSYGQDELIQRAGKKYSVHWSNIKWNIAERGVTDSAKLPLYHYLDDGFKIWDALEVYTRNIIDQFYPDDATVTADKEHHGSVHHAAVNLGQYVYYGFMPNLPVRLHIPAPTKKQLLKGLHTDTETQLVVGLANLVSAYSPNAVRVQAIWVGP